MTSSERAVRKEFRILEKILRENNYAMDRVYGLIDQYITNLAEEPQSLDGIHVDLLNSLKILNGEDIEEN